MARLLQVNPLPGTATDAGCRTFSTAIETVLTNGGWVKVREQFADGATSLATVVPVSVASGGATAIFAWQLWRMNDALQGVAPCFMLLRFRRGGNTNNFVQVEIAVGTSDPGAPATNLPGGLLFNLTGNAAFEGFPGQPPQSGGATDTQYVTAGPGYFGLVYTSTAFGATCTITLERRRVPSGQYGSSGFIYFNRNPGISNIRMTTLAAVSAAQIPFAAIPNTVADATNGTDSTVAPPMAFQYLPGETSPLTLVTVPITQNTEFTTSVFGSTRNYISTHPIANANTMHGATRGMGGEASTMGSALLWE